MQEILRKTNKELNESGIYIKHRRLIDNVDIHWHEFYEIEYVTDGRGKVYINEKVYELKPNTMLFLSPVDFEKIEVENSISIINLAFSGAVISSDIASYLPSGSVIYDYPPAIFEILLNESNINDSWFNKKYINLVNSVLIDIVRESYFSEEATEYSPIIKALGYMDLNFKKTITLEQISNHVGLTPTYFSHIFHQQMKVTFKEYLLTLRLEYAAKLLLISDYSSTEICYNSGFNDFSNFSRAFKKRFSASPCEYRKKRNF